MTFHPVEDSEVMTVTDNLLLVAAGIACDKETAPCSVRCVNYNSNDLHATIGEEGGPVPMALNAVTDTLSDDGSRRPVALNR